MWNVLQVVVDLHCTIHHDSVDQHHLIYVLSLSLFYPMLACSVVPQARNNSSLNN